MFGLFQGFYCKFFTETCGRKLGRDSPLSRLFWFSKSGPWTGDDLPSCRYSEMGYMIVLILKIDKFIREVKLLGLFLQLNAFNSRAVLVKIVSMINSNY